MLISEDAFKFFANILNAKVNWNRITHRIFFSLSLYVLLYPFVAFNLESNLAIIFNGIYDTLNLLGFQIVMFMFSFVGIGFATRRTLKQSILRLNIKFPNLKYAILGVVAIFLIDYLVWGVMDTFSQFIGGEFARKTVEESSNVENTIETIRRFAPSISELALISIVVGVSEELLFRGALQPRFGNFYTSLLFASLHFQYLSVIALIEIFIISYVLGIIKEKTNTSTTAISHIIYDFISLIGL
jgi:membrane protease YdiL (CAAX protease family)